MINDAHCHFFSRRFFETLARDAEGLGPGDPAAAATAALGWEPPGAPAELADRWAAELDRHGVSRAALIASAPGDEQSVAEAAARHPGRFVGWFMLDPTGEDAARRTEEALGGLRLRGVCLFPAMHRYRLDDERVRRVVDVAAGHPGAAVFVHCGFLSVGVRKRLGLPSRFDVRLGDPLALPPLAHAHPRLPFIVPHFGAGFLREALMAADLCPNVHLDTSSSNGWTRYHPGLTLADVFRQALAVAGAGRLLFGSDSSFFPRGWRRPVWEAQTAALDAAGGGAQDADRIFGGNFEELFGAG